MAYAKIDKGTSFFSAQLLAEEVFLLPEFRREIGAEVFHLVKRANLNFRVRVERSPLEPFDSLIDGLNAPYPVARNQFPCLGKRSIGDNMACSGELHAFAARTWPKTVGDQQEARFGQLFVVLAYFCEEFSAGNSTGLRFLARFHYDHHPHRFFSVFEVELEVSFSKLSLVCRMGPEEIDTLQLLRRQAGIFTQRLRLRRYSERLRVCADLRR